MTLLKKGNIVLFLKIYFLIDLSFSAKNFCIFFPWKGIPAFGYGDYGLYFKNQDQPAVKKLDLQIVDKQHEVPAYPTDLFA